MAAISNRDTVSLLTTNLESSMINGVPPPLRKGGCGMRRKMVLTLLAAMMGLSLAAPALADAPGPGDNQCRGATGNNNPHCPPGK